MSQRNQRSRRRQTERIQEVKRKPEKMLSQSAYWDRRFLLRLYGWLDEAAFHDPQEAYRVAEPLVTVVDHRIHVRDRVGSYLDLKDRRSWRVMGRVLKASCARRVGKLTEAMNLYDEAFTITEEGEITTLAKAELYVRYGFLLEMQGKAEALDCAERVLSFAPEFASAYLLRGISSQRILGESRPSDFAEALRLTVNSRGTRRGRREFLSALQCVAKTLADNSAALDEQERAFRLLVTVQRQFLNKTRSVPKMIIYWQLGRIAANLGAERQAERLLIKARSGLARLGDVYEYALCSLDLAQFYLGDASGKLEVLLEDTEAALRSFGALDLLEAVAPWRSDLSVSRLSRIGARIRATQEH